LFAGFQDAPPVAGFEAPGSSRLTRLGSDGFLDL